MINRERELARLCKAETDIIAGERRLTRLLVKIERLRADGRETTIFEQLVGSFEGNLEGWRAHRDEILGVLETASTIINWKRTDDWRNLRPSDQMTRNGSLKGAGRRC